MSWLALLFVAQTVLLGYSAWIHSPTWDEVGHLAAGISHWKFGRFDLFSVNPPLVRTIAAAPVVLFCDPKMDWDRSDPKLRSDREAYLAIHEPSRVWQSAEPGPGVSVLTPQGSTRLILQQGESVRLQVKTTPEMPATFTSFDLGAFDNGLSSITVAADKQGLATATFHGAPGKVNEVNVLAASPVASDRIHFELFVKPPTVATVVETLSKPDPTVPTESSRNSSTAN